MQKCKYCKHWNDFAHTYVKRHEHFYDPKTREELFYTFDCCSYYHEAYCWDENFGERVKECCQPQLTLF